MVDRSARSTARRQRIQRLVQRPKVNRAARRFLALQRRLLAAQNRAAARNADFIDRSGYLIEHGALKSQFSHDAHRQVLLSYYRHLSNHVPTLPLQPRISVVIPVYRPDPRHLRQALASLQLQVYPHWEACLVDDHSEDETTTRILEGFKAAFPDQVRLAVHDRNRHISAASNTAVEMASGDYVAFLDQDDLLYPHALAELAKFLNAEHDRTGHVPEIVFSDERVVGPEGELINDSWFKPDWSWYLHLGTNYTNHLTAYDRELVRSIGGLREGYEGAQDHDLMLRAVDAATTPVGHVPIVLYQWRSHERSTAGSEGGAAKPYARKNGLRAVEEAAARRGRKLRAEVEPFTQHHRLRFELPDPLPTVSVIIPTKDSTEVLRTCLDSILQKTSYPRLDIVVVDNGSTDAEALALLDELTSVPSVTVIADPAYFNFARLNNIGVEAATGDFIVLLNNDTEVVSPDWVQEMLMYAQFPDVGAVGAKLLYPSGRIQHGGLVGAAAHVADVTAAGVPDDHHFYMDLPHVVHEAIAVTGAALMIARSTWLEVNGLDEMHVPNAYGDVDLCLRLREAGLRVVYTPHAVLIHHESVSRSRNVELSEGQYMRRRWGWQLLNDIYLNDNYLRSGRYTQDLDYIQPEIPKDLFQEWLSAGRIPF